MSSTRKSAKKDKNQGHYNQLSTSDSTANETAFSDSEAVYEHHGGRRPLGYYQLASSLPDLKAQHLLSSLEQTAPPDHELTDNDRDDTYLDFGQAYGNKNVRTGRQRKKIAARSKGGEFQTRRKKRRVYFCCISSEIDIQKLQEYLINANDLLYDWKLEMYNDVLHLYKPGTEEIPAPGRRADRNSITGEDTELLTSYNPLNSLPLKIDMIPKPQPAIYATDDENTKLGVETTISFDEYLKSKIQRGADEFGRQDSQQTGIEDLKPENNKLLSYASKEVFVYDFGAAVFWGFSRGEEVGLLKTIRMFVTKGMVGVHEFEYGEDDMAFVISPDQKIISLANDVITLPDDTTPKQRMAVSFAIAQSSVLAIFEARIEQKIEEYKYIPEALAAYGKLDLSERQLGMMIGEVFVIRHDVNLHTEILGTYITLLSLIVPSSYLILCRYSGFLLERTWIRSGL